MNETQYDFFAGNSPDDLCESFGSPLYVYNESILRRRCREMKSLVDYENFAVNYSAKANANLYLLKIVRDEGLKVDAMSPGEIYAEELAGFAPEDIFFVCNNVSEEEMKYAIDRNITVSADSLSQLERFGAINGGGRVAVRFNPGVGAGGHEKVVTGGTKSKFGINPDDIPEVKAALKKYGLRLVGVNQHIGSLFMEPGPYIEAFGKITDVAQSFDDLEFIDLGGGFGIPYSKGAGEKRFDLGALGEKLGGLMRGFAADYGKKIKFIIEPGRYIAAECCTLLGTAHAAKTNGGRKFIGTDIGFNILMRPALYGSYHEIEVYGKNKQTGKQEIVSVTGNICEAGDIIAADRLLPEISVGGRLGALDAGAYGYAMSCNYNNRPRPAEIFIKENGAVVLTRKRDTLEDVVRGFEGLY